MLENTFQKDRILAAVPGDQDALVRIVDDKLISADIQKSNVVKRSWPGGKIEHDIIAAVSIDNERVGARATDVYVVPLVTFEHVVPGTGLQLITPSHPLQGIGHSAPPLTAISLPPIHP